MSQTVAVALLTAHTTVHSATPAPTHHSPKLDRPRIDIGVSAEDWKLFESRWKLYIKSANISPSDRTTQLFHCTSDQLGDAVLRLCDNVADKTEDELLTVVKSLAVIPVSTVVMRAELIAMRQTEMSRSDRSLLEFVEKLTSARTVRITLVNVER